MLGPSPLSPALMEGFGLSRLDVAFIVPAVYVGGLLFSLPGGHLADKWGVRPTLLGALALGGVGLLLASTAPHFPIFLLCLVLAGSGWSVVNPVLGKAIVDLFPLTERGLAMGIKQMGLTLGGGASALVLPSIAAPGSCSRRCSAPRSS
jgi:MFS transporter, ACS family, hexuronate transporter